MEDISKNKISKRKSNFGNRQVGASGTTEKVESPTSSQSRSETAQSTNLPQRKQGGVKPRRRPLAKAHIRPNDVYISEKSNIRAQLDRCKKLFDENHQEIFLHGLGKAIPRTINIATELKTHYLNTVDFETETSTIKLVDDLVPEDDATPASYASRNVSTVTIHLFRTVKLP